MKKLMGVESSNGVVERHWMHEDGGKKLLTIERVQDVAPILKKNREEMNSASRGYGKSDLQKVASIPTVVLEDICVMKGIKFAELIHCKTDRSKAIWNELLNSSDFRAFRTKPGVVKINGN
jgi:hypothetical protein